MDYASEKQEKNPSCSSSSQAQPDSFISDTSTSSPSQ